MLRDGASRVIDASRLVPGDVLVIEEGDRISADARLLDGGVEVDLSTLTGESMPVFRAADLEDTERSAAAGPRPRLLRARPAPGGKHGRSCSPPGCTPSSGGSPRCPSGSRQEESPLEGQVRRVAWLIAAIAVVIGVAFVPLATLAAGLPLSDAVVFAVGLLVGNVPEGLLPVITLALAVGVRGLVRRGAVVKRLSAVETLGSTSVICTDKTGTLTENRMRVTAVWTAPQALELETSTTSAPPSERDALPDAGAGDGCLQQRQPDGVGAAATRPRWRC